VLSRGNKDSKLTRIRKASYILSFAAQIVTGTSEQKALPWSPPPQIPRGRTLEMIIFVAALAATANGPVMAPWVFCDWSGMKKIFNLGAADTVFRGQDRSAFHYHNPPDVARLPGATASSPAPRQEHKSRQRTIGLGLRRCPFHRQSDQGAAKSVLFEFRVFPPRTSLAPSVAVSRDAPD
jgi:hypothetical protein